MVTRLVSEDFYWFLANASGCQYPQLQKLIYLGSLPRRFGLEGKKIAWSTNIGSGLEYKPNTDFEVYF